MDRQGSKRGRKSFGKASKEAKELDHLLQLAVGEERQALDDLFISSGSHLYQAAFRILSNPQDAEDAVQDSLLCAFRNLNQFRGNARISTWLYRITVNSSLMRLRKRKCRPESPLETVFTGNELVASRIDPFSDDRNPEEQCARVEQGKILSAALLELPSPFRTVIEICDLEEISTKEAAQKLEIPLSTLKARLFRARRALKATILKGLSVTPLFRTAGKNARWRIPEDRAGKIESLPAM